MKNKNVLIVFLFVFGFSVRSQGLLISKVVVDKDTKIPLENVIIFNEKDNSLTNDEGLFFFVSSQKEISFSLMGYVDLKTTFEKLKSKDTIFMKQKVVELQEVVVNDKALIIKKAYDNIKTNYLLKPYSENFFARCLLKKDNEIVRLQDVYGKVSRQTLFQTVEIKDNKYEVEILNMRKVGVSKKGDPLYFEFQNFNDLLNLSSSIYLKSRDLYDFIEEKAIDSDCRKISYITKEKNDMGQNASGYFVINKKDYAIKEFCINFYSDSVPFQGDKNHKFRTTAYQVIVSFRKNLKINKYYLSNVKIESKLDVLDNGKGKATIYDYSMRMFTTNSFTNENVVSNFSCTKDIFKAKFLFSEEFWKNQNQLPLTKELNDFLKQVSLYKDNKKEFELIGNF